MRTQRIRILGALVVLGLGFAAPSLAADVALQNATATYTQRNPCCTDLWHPRNTIDGSPSGSFTSWAASRPDGDPHAETLVWETQFDLTVGGSAPLRFALHQQDFVPRPGHNLGRFRLSYTTDDRNTFADGLDIGGDVTATWVVIAPMSARSTGGELFTTLADSSILVSGPLSGYPTYTINSLISASGITGFRLETMKDASLPHGGPGRFPDNGVGHLSEFIVNTIPEPASALLAMLGVGALAGWWRVVGRSRA